MSPYTDGNMFSGKHNTHAASTRLTPAQQADVAALRTQLATTMGTIRVVEESMRILETQRSELIDQIDAIETPDGSSVPDGTDDIPEHDLVR